MEAADYARAGEYKKSLEKYQSALEKAYALKDDYGIGFCLYDLGLLYYGGFQDYPKALEYLSSAKSHFQKIKHLKGEGLVLLAIADVYFESGDNEKAIESFNNALPIGDEVLKHSSENEKKDIINIRANFYIKQAEAHRKLGEFAEAVETYHLAANDFLKVDKLDFAGDVLTKSGDVLRLNLNAPLKSIDDYTQASLLLSKSGNDTYAASAKWGLGWSYLNINNYEQAAKTFAEVLDVARREKIPELVIKGHSGIGYAFEALYKFEQAIDHYHRALLHIRENNWKSDPLMEPWILYNKAEVHRLLGQYEKAFEDFLSASLIFRERDNAVGEAAAVAGIAKMLSWYGDSSKAIFYHKRALDLYRKEANTLKQVEILIALARISLMRGPVEGNESIEYFKEAHKLLYSLEKEKGIIPPELLLKIKKIKAPSRKTDEYLRSVTEGWPDMREEDVAAAAELYETIMSSQLRFQTWLKMVPSLGSEYLAAAGALYQEAGIICLFLNHPDEAIAEFTLADAYHTTLPFNRDIGFNLMKDWSLLAEAFLRQGKYELALRYYRLAYHLAFILPSPERHILCIGLAKVYRGMGDIEIALSYYKLALQLFEDIWAQQSLEETKIELLEGSIFSYKDLLTLFFDLYHKTGDRQYLRSAFEYNEKIRMRSFLSMLGKSNLIRHGGQIGNLASEENKILYKIAQVYSELENSKMDLQEEKHLLNRLDDLRQDWQILQRQKAQKSLRYEDRALLKPVSIEEIQSVLDDQTVLLEYSVGYDSSILWTITKDNFDSYLLPGQEELPSIQAYLKTLRVPLMGKDEITRHVALGQKLYKLGIEPTKEHLRNKKHLIIAADGILNYLPFEALINNESSDRLANPQTLTDIPYLIKEFQVSYIPSGSVLVAQSRDRTDSKDNGQFPLLAFGDAIYREPESDAGLEIDPRQIHNVVLRDAHLDRLKYSGDEVRRIADIWGVSFDSEHINIREKATVKRLLELDLSKYHILHFATHAIFQDDVELATQPTLVLSQSDQEVNNSLLTFSDILNLRLNAELVTLSACNTGLGRPRLAEGLIGLTRAFMYAGASSVLVSLWKVEDQSTSLLMENFYRALKQGKSKAEALRQSKLEVINSTIDMKAIDMQQSLSSPFYWAPFILVGEAD